MPRLLYPVALVVGIPLLTWLYMTVSFGPAVDRVFLSVATFLFSIFTGFFISRQASRYNRVRETVTAFDGKLSSIYRASAHVSSELQKAVGKIVKKHYEKILESGKWDIHFHEKSTTLSSLHAALEKHVTEDEVTKLSNQALGAIIKGLSICQDLRKQMVALYEERIPLEQWILIWFFAVILLATVSSIPSVDVFFWSLLKAAFVVSVFSVMLILYRLNRLDYSERIMGEHSAHDVLDIIGGKK